MSNRNHGSEGTEVAEQHHGGIEGRLRRVENLVHGSDDDELIRKSLQRRVESHDTLIKWGIRIFMVAAVAIISLVAKALAGVVAAAVAK